MTDLVESDRIRKSVGKEKTFLDDLKSEEEVTQSLRQIANLTFAALKKNQKHGKTVVLKIRYNDFSTFTRRKTFPNYIQDADELFVIALRIFEEEGSLTKGVRLLGITVTNLDSLLFENIPLPLWIKQNKMNKKENSDVNKT